MKSGTIVKGPWYSFTVCASCGERDPKGEVVPRLNVCAICGGTYRNYAEVFEKRIFRKVKHQIPFLWIFKRTVKVEYEEKT